MTGSGMRRKVRKRKSKSENSRVKISVFLGIILLAVLLGFLTARFVIGPIIGYNADESPVQLNSADKAVETEKDADKSKVSKNSEAEKAANTQAEADANNDADTDAAEEAKTEQTAKETESEKGYALQFGAFSTKDSAQELSDALQSKGIKTKIVEADNVFKVISPVLEDKEDALKALSESKEKEVEDVFITSVS